MAKRKLADRTEAGVGRMTLAKLGERYMATVRNQKPKTLKGKNHLQVRILADFREKLT